MRWILAAAICGLLVACSENDSDDDAPEPTPTAEETAAPTKSETPSETTAPDPTATPTPDAEVEPPTASPYIGGSEGLELPTGEPGELSIIGVGPPGEAVVVVLRNNTDTPVVDIRLEGTAYDAAGEIIASGEDQGVEPALVEPGEIAFGYVYFGEEVDLASDTEIEVAARADEGYEMFGFVNLDILEVGHTGDQIVGVAANFFDFDVFGPISLLGVRFDASGAPTHDVLDFVEVEEVLPGEEIDFAIDLDRPCDRFVVAAGGYEF